MPSSKRCLFGCVTTGVPIHSFPNPNKKPELFKKWVDLAVEYGVESVRGMTHEKIYKSKKVCDKHFSEYVKNRYNRLNNLAIPTLHLSKSPVVLGVHVDSLSSTSQLPEQDAKETPIDLDDHSDNSQYKLSTTIEIPFEETHFDLDDHSYNTPYKLSSTVQLPDAESVIIVGGDIDSLLTFTSQSPAPPAIETPIDLDDYNDNIQYDDLPSIVQPVAAPKKKLNQKIKQLRSEISRLRKRNRILKTRLAEARKTSNSAALEKITESMIDSVALERITKNMSESAKIFTEIQYRTTLQNPKGHRFTEEEKILALSLYNRCPKVYGLLSEFFTLPTRKTLKSLRENT